jgi:hypothetical protein
VQPGHRQCKQQEQQGAGEKVPVTILITSEVITAIRHLHTSHFRSGWWELQQHTGKHDPG